MIGVKKIDFQDECVDKMISLSNTSKEGIVIKSPTGSGKTIILLKYIEAYFNNFDDDAVFVWFCPGAGDLEEQSKAEMEKHMKDRVAKDLDDTLRNGFDAGDTVFINWEKVNNANKKAMTESEHKNLIDQIAKAHRAGLKFIIIVDEEHAYNTTKSQAVINEFNSKLIIRVSATAKKNNKFEWIEIDERDVINAQLITKALYINEGVTEGNITNENELLLKLADEKRKAIRDEYKNIGADINPLVLIQFPDKSKDLIESIEKILNNMGYTYENKALAKWMSDKSDKINLDGIKAKNGEQQFLLMKQAVATGWNCTRAKILVKLRENMSEDFQIQTIGRIRRMPESHFYDKELLDNCYLYTFDEDYKESVKAELFSAYSVKRIKLKDKCKTFSIKKENRDQDASGLGDAEVFRRIKKFMTDKYHLTATTKNKPMLEAGKYDISDKIKYDVKTGKEVLTSGLLKAGDTVTLTKDVKTHYDGLDLKQTTDMLKSELKTDYSTASRVLHKLFYGKKNSGKLLKLTTSEYYAFIINNRDLLKYDFREAMSEIAVDPSFKVLPKTSEFKIPEEDLFLYDDSIEDVKVLLSNAYEDYTTDCFVKGLRSKPERLFERYCENVDEIEWVYKNGDKGAEYFSLVYYDGMMNQCLFYPDYIIKMKDESIWIIETKGGESDSGSDDNIDKYAKKKFDALKEYARHHHINFGFVRNKNVDDVPRLFLNNTEYTDEMTDNWKRLENFF